MKMDRLMKYLITGKVVLIVACVMVLINMMTGENETFMFAVKNAVANIILGQVAFYFIKGDESE